MTNFETALVVTTLCVRQEMTGKLLKSSVPREGCKSRTTVKHRCGLAHVTLSQFFGRILERVWPEFQSDLIKNKNGDFTYQICGLYTAPTLPHGTR